MTQSTSVSTEALADQLFEKLKHVPTSNTFCAFTRERCQNLAPLVEEIQRLKKQENALVLAHSYLSPEILYSVADYVGDSYELSLRAQKATENTIVFAAVDFMAETAKILNPNKRVLKPNRNGGCSLAESITAKEVRALRQLHPDFTFICYINTSADVKAECDITVTSSNVMGIIETIPNDKIFFLPDRLMAENIRAHLLETRSTKTVLSSDGTCYVHEEFDASTIHAIRRQHPGVVVLAHPECSPEVTQLCDFVGSTSAMIKHVQESSAKKFFMMTECGLVNRLQVERPSVEMVGACRLCRYMKSNSLEDIRRVLENPQPSDEVILDEAVSSRALRTLEAMFTYTEQARRLGLIH